MNTTSRGAPAAQAGRKKMNEEIQQPVIKTEFTEREIKVILQNLQNQININVQILFDNTYEPAGECFCVLLEALNEVQKIYVDLNALLPKQDSEI